MSKNDLHSAHELCWHQLNGQIRTARHITATSPTIWQKTFQAVQRIKRGIHSVQAYWRISVQKVKRSVIYLHLSSSLFYSVTYLPLKFYSWFLLPLLSLPFLVRLTRSRSGVLLAKLRAVAAQLLKACHDFYRTRKFVTVFTTAHYWSEIWYNCIRCT